MRNSNNCVENRSPWSLWLLFNVSCILVFIGGCNGGSDSSSPYGSTLVVKYYSDPQCNSEAPIPGSRFSISSSGETSCKENQAYKWVTLSVDPSAVSCDPTNPTSCRVENGASVTWRGECNEDCTQCERVTSSDSTSAVGDCVEIPPGGNAKDASGYLRVTTAAYTGALYLGASETGGSSIKMYDPHSLDSVYLDTSGSRSNYPISLAVSQSDLANGYSNVLYGAINGDNVLWQCEDTQENSCGTWKTAPERPNAFVAGDAGFMYVGMKTGVIWRCPTNAANACVTYATLPPNTQNPTSILSLAYDPGSNTLYAGTGCKSCDTNFIYSVPLGKTDATPQLVSSISAGTNSNCTSSIEDLECGAGKIWAALSVSCLNSQGTYQYGGGLLSCDPSGPCNYVGPGGNTWGVTYDPDDNLVFASQVPHSDFNGATGLIQVISADSGDVGTPINIGSLGDGFISDNLGNPGFPPNALLYAGGYLFFGTGNCDSASCNSLFRCPVGENSGGCVQVKLACNSVSSCNGAQSLAFIGDLNYPF
jgi:hypothetical protein